MRKVKAIKFSEFMDGSYKKNKRKNETILKGYVFSPFMMIDPIVLTIGGVVIVLAVVQKVLEYQGNYDLAEGLQTIIFVVFSIASFFGIMHLLNVASVNFL